MDYKKKKKDPKQTIGLLWFGILVKVREEKEGADLVAMSNADICALSACILVYWILFDYRHLQILKEELWGAVPG